MEDVRETSTMKEFGKEHELEYRKEVLKPLFDCIRGAESCYLIGAGSMGKTRILDHMIRTDVQAHYLKDKAAHTLIFRLDMNRLSDYSEWEFYELALFNIVQTIGQKKDPPELTKISAQFLQNFLLPVLDHPGNPIKVLRFLELAISNLMVLDDSISICFLLDEFDEAYRRLPAKVFAHLRGIRDTHKNRLCYALLLRNLPARLRPQLHEHEGFYELLSRNEIAIGPYTQKDAFAMLSQLEERRKRSIQVESTREKFYELSGGHSGLLQALFSLLLKTPEGDPHLFDARWLTRQDSIKDECLKLLQSLELDEAIGITEYAHGNLAELSAQMHKILRTKGLLLSDGQMPKVFSPIFDQYLQQVDVAELKRRAN
jgi:hypothetical protein